MTEHEKIDRARQQIEALTGFYVHLAIFVAVMVLLLVINLMSKQAWWVHWPLLGWGVGVAAHAVVVLGSSPHFITRWQLRKIKELKDRM